MFWISCGVKLAFSCTNIPIYNTIKQFVTVPVTLQVKHMHKIVTFDWHMEQRVIVLHCACIGITPLQYEKLHNLRKSGPRLSRNLVYKLKKEFRDTFTWRTSLKRGEGLSECNLKMSQLRKFWYLSHRRPAKAQALVYHVDVIYVAEVRHTCVVLCNKISVKF